MKNRNYWKERSEELEKASHDRGASYFSQLQQQYDIASQKIQDDVNKWYARFAKNNEISMQEARKLLTSDELKEFQWSVQEYIEKGRKNGLSGQWSKQLENASARVHISRLDSLKMQMQNHIEMLYRNESEDMTNVMKDIYTNGFYHTAYEVQKGFEKGFPISKLNKDEVNKVISKPWAADGSNFSDRIWKQRNQLISELHNNLSQAIIRGKSPFEVTDVIAKRFNVSKNQAGRLVMTESAFFAEESSKDAYKELGVEQYEILATLDSHTSEICQDLDGQVFNMSEYEVGVTAPPFHCYCRSTTIPYFDDEFELGIERAARGQDGSTYYVPADMKYSDWKKTFVNKDGSGIIKNITIDDFEDAAVGKNIAPEILQVINDNCKDKGMFFNEVVIEKIQDDETGHRVLLQTEPYFGGRQSLTRLKINENVFRGRTVEEIDEMIKRSKNTVANNLKEAVWHENGHAKIYYRKSLDDIEQINKKLDEIHEEGISALAARDGSELIAEMEILLKRGESISDKLMVIYNQYIGG